MPRANVDAFAASVVVVLCLSWGLSQVAMKVANAGIQPVFQAGLRSGLGGLSVLLWCRWRGVRLFDRDGTLWPGLLAGGLFGSEFILIYVGFEYTTVSRGILFVYTMPFFVAAGAHLLIPGERLTALRSLGFCAAFAGVVIVFADRQSATSADAWFGDLLCLIAAAAWAATTLTIKTTRLRQVAAEKVLVYQLAVSALMGFALAPLFGPLFRDVTPLVVAAFAYQVFPVVAVSYIAWFWILLRYPASQLSAFTFLTPVFSVLFGALLLSEPVTGNLGLALFLVAAGIYLVNRPRRA
ncbi:MAG TPA: DMT family transporter [Bauldia sp.]|nr:DMT family transporter [Bauldia sp.]